MWALAIATLISSASAREAKLLPAEALEFHQLEAARETIYMPVLALLMTSVGASISSGIGVALAISNTVLIAEAVFFTVATFGVGLIAALIMPFLFLEAQYLDDRLDLLRKKSGLPRK